MIACSTGVLLSLGWPDKGFSPLLLFAFVPLLWVENYIAADENKRFGRFAGFFYSYVSFLIWNILTTYWVWYSTPVAALAFTLNSLFMAFAFQLFHYVRKRLRWGVFGYLFLPLFWIAFEYAHLNWDGSWPWLTLGNGFATLPQIVQWYQLTGVLGGTLWILASNILALKLVEGILRKEKKKILLRKAGILSSAIFVPVVLSLVMYFAYDEPADARPVEVVVVQPNVDPWTAQYDLPFDELTDQLISLAREKATSTTEFFITPESSIQENIDEEYLRDSYSYQVIRSFLNRYEKMTAVVGLSSYANLPEGVQTPAMREYKNRRGMFYERYNSALLINHDTSYQLLHKSKLTPGVEIMPLQRQLPFIKKLALNLGGTIGSLGIDKERQVFQSGTTGTKVAATICYESIYGEYVGEYVRKGAELIFIVTDRKSTRLNSSH